jgi:hypothetical protein
VSESLDKPGFEAGNSEGIAATVLLRIRLSNSLCPL